MRHLLLGPVRRLALPLGHDWIRQIAPARHLHLPAAARKESQSSRCSTVSREEEEGNDVDVDVDVDYMGARQEASAQAVREVREDGEPKPGNGAKERKVKAKRATKSPSNASKVADAEGVTDTNPGQRWLVECQESDYRIIKDPAYSAIPQLAYSLERSLFQPGITMLQCPRTAAFNLDPNLLNITQPQDFDYNSLPPYSPPSKDQKLAGMATEIGCDFVGSTSTLTNLLGLIWLLIGGGKSPDLSQFSSSLLSQQSSDPPPFTRYIMSPTSTNLVSIPSSDVIALDAGKSSTDRSDDQPRDILLYLGRSMELFLTSPPQVYRKHLKSASEPRQSPNATTLPQENQQPVDNPLCYNFAAIGKFLLRSQIDAYHPGLPKKTFDIKTRAVFPIRMDPSGHLNFENYRLSNLHGPYSFEREYYDLIRGAMLKYMFQALIGNMDGIFVAYHNTKQLFGFQYVAMEEMERIIFGSVGWGPTILVAGMKILSKICEETKTVLIGRNGRLHMKVNYEKRTADLWLEVLKKGEPPSVELVETEPSGVVLETTKSEREVHKWTLDLKVMLANKVIRRNSELEIPPTATPSTHPLSLRIRIKPEKADITELYKLKLQIPSLHTPEMVEKSLYRRRHSGLMREAWKHMNNSNNPSSYSSNPNSNSQQSVSKQPKRKPRTDPKIAELDEVEQLY